MLFSRTRWVHNSEMSASATRRTGIVVFALAAFGAAACGGSTKPAAVVTTSTSSSITTTTLSTTTTTTVAGATTTTSPGLANWVTPQPKADGSIAVATFNARVDAADPTWATSPERIADEFTNTDLADANNTVTQVTALSPQEADVVVSVNGVRDDSVHAIRYEVHLVRQPDQTWRLATATWSQQCQPNRGHQTFSTALCI